MTTLNDFPQFQDPRDSVDAADPQLLRGAMTWSRNFGRCLGRQVGHIVDTLALCLGRERP